MENRIAPSRGRITAICCGIVVLLITTTLAFRSLLVMLALGPIWGIVAGGIVPALLVILATIAIEKYWTGESLGTCLRSLGLGAPDPWQSMSSLPCAIPIIIAYLVIFLGFRLPSEPVPHLPWIVAKFVISQGIGEEIVFRDFAFRWLRNDRSFWRAAILSAALFSSVHLAHLIHGTSVEILTNMTISIAVSFLMGLAFANLFELGGNVIWGCVWLHVAVDSGNWLAHAPDAGLNPAYCVYMLGVLTSLGLTFLANSWKR